MNFLAVSQITNFSDIGNWSFLIQLFYVVFALAIGNILRRKIPFLRKSLIPTAIIAGLIILLLKSFLKYVLNIDATTTNGSAFLVDEGVMELITYHMLGLGFVAVALKKNPKKDKKQTMTVIDSGAITVGTYLVQAVFALTITIIAFYLCRLATRHLGWEENPTKWFAGLLLPLGFGQGTGQAGTWGRTYESKFGFSGGTSFGLTIATIGFIVASIGGVIYLAYLRRKKLISKNVVEHLEKNTLDVYESKNEIPTTESVDKLTVQFILVFVVYALAFLAMFGIEKLIVPLLGNFGTNTVSPLIWGFNFLIGTVMAAVSKAVINGLKKKKVMKREYASNYLLDRISGFFFDIMIVAGTAAINLNDLTKTWGIILIVCIIGAIVTFVYVKLTTKEVYKDYPHEGFLAMFGMLTGTASNGMILLREIDPKYETPMANNLVFQSLPAIIFGFPFLLLLGVAAESMTNSLIVLAALTIYLIAITIFIFRKRIFKKRVKKEQTKQ